MGESVLLFFDTFVVSNEDKTQMNCIRFANMVSVTEIRIIPFGTVVESNISDEPVFGATNPAFFNLKIYGYNDTNSSTFFPLAECGYDESDGICSMPLTHPAMVNLILLRGNYSTVTIAVFGAPLFPAGLPIPNFSVPPPPLVANAPNYPVAPIIGPVGCMNNPQNQAQNPTTSWSKSLGSVSNLDKSIALPSSPALLQVSQLAFEDKHVEDEASVKEEAETPEKEPKATGSMNVPHQDNLEDEAVLNKEVKLLESNDPLLKPTHWKFDPTSLVNQPANTLPGVNRKRLPCPTLTLFEVHKWLMSSNCSNDWIDQDADSEEGAWSDFPLLNPPLGDKATAQKHAERLLKACEEYGTEDNFPTEWLNTLEELIPNLASALAYLSVFQTESYEPTIRCLHAWARCGLKVERVLGQPVSTAADGLRHLRAGVSLAGALHSSAAPRLPLLLPLYEQRTLLELLECPLTASTPLRLHVLLEGLENTLSTPAGFTAFVGLAEGTSDGPTPYQRLVRFLVKTNKSLPVALAGNRLLAKVKFYDILLQFHNFIKNLKSSKGGGEMEEEKEHLLQTEVQQEGTLHSYLQAISRAIIDPEAVLSPVPRNAPKIRGLKSSANLSSVLYRLLDSINFLDHLAWLLERLSKGSVLSATMDATTDVLSKLLSTSSGLLFVASSPQAVDRILRSQLVSEDSQNGKRQLSRLGLEMAVKLEALGCVDSLVALTRRKGETGLQRYVTSEDTSDPFDPLRSSVFALAQLFLVPTFAPWTAEVLAGAGGDHFVPILMLLEALHRSDEASKSADNESGQAENDAKLESDSQEGERTVGESYLGKLGFSGECLELSSLLSIITVGVLRHASNVSFLERLGSRLLRTVQSTQWEDRVSNLPASELFQHHRGFPEAGAPWLSWLREAPNPTLSDNDDLFAFYVEQLASLVEVFEESSHPPPAILLLLRLLRFYSAKSNVFMVELYARDGLVNLTALVESAAEWIMTSSSVCTLTVDVMAEAVDLLGDLVEALIEGMGGEFRDRMPIKVVCKAYTAVSAPSNRATSERIHRSVLRCITAYANTDDQLESREGGEKDLWTLVCRDIFEFVTSSPLYFQPGMLLLLDLLPLPLPVASLQALPPAEKQTLIANREWWCRRLTRDLSIEVCGLVELFSASSPVSSLHRLLTTFVDRILGLDTQSLLIPQLLASSAAETLIEVYHNAATAASEMGKSSGNGGGGCGEIGDLPQQQGEGGEGGSSSSDFVVPSTIKTLTPGNRLVLGTQQPPSLPDQVSASNTSGSAEDAVVMDFGNIVDVTEIVHALSLLHFILKHPICKQAFLKSLRADVASGSRSARSQRLLSIFSSILEASIPIDASRYHAEAQGKLISCLECILDTGMGLCREGKESAATASYRVKEEGEDLELSNFANHLPPVAWLSDLVGSLLMHLQTGSLSGKRNPAALTRVIDLLHGLAQHDFGFTLIQRHLCQKSQEATFVVLLERFSASEASTLLRSFLRLVSALLADPIFTEEVVLATQGETAGTNGGGGEQPVGERRLRLPTLRLRQLLAGKEENVVGRVVTLLETAIRAVETTSASSSSLQRLCDGMKSLQNLLGAPGDFSLPADSVQPLPLPSGPEPLPLIAPHRSTINWIVSNPSELACVGAELDRCLTQRFPASEGADEAPLRTANLLAYADQVCPGVDLRAERTRRRKRDVDDADSTIQHKRRKRGQTTDIIQTGRSSKKYVAPMRGRGFSVRQSSNSIGVSSLRGGGSSGDSLLGNATGRPDSFRSRPQNTSRPPSMHVDDFNKLAKDETVASISRDVRETTSYVRDSSGSGALRGSFRGARGGGMAGTQRVLSSLPFIGSASGSGVGGGTGNSILSTPPVASANVVVPLQSWTGSSGGTGGGVQQITHHPHLLTLTNPILPANRSSSSGNMQPPRID